MTTHHNEKLATVGVSISESPDLWSLGLSEGHLRSAMAEIALKILASGSNLAYGGDLRKDGFTEFLADLEGRYRNHPQHRGTITVTDYLAWPVHIQMTPDEIDTFLTDYEPGIRLVFLALDGHRIGLEKRLKLCAHEPNDEEWTVGLTTMRTTMREDIQARIVLGGRLEGYRGSMPGIAEEVRLSLESRQPVFLVGGFGGCTRDIAETLGLVERWAGSRYEWTNRERFLKYSPDDLHNGLSREENATLARTPHIREAVTLVSRGLRRILNHGKQNAQSIH